MKKIILLVVVALVSLTSCKGQSIRQEDINRQIELRAVDYYIADYTALKTLQKFVINTPLSEKDKKMILDFYNEKLSHTFGFHKNYTSLNKTILINMDRCIKYVKVKGKSDAAYEILQNAEAKVAILEAQ